MRERVLVIGSYQQTITVIRSLAREGHEVVVGRHARKAFTDYSRFAPEVWSHPNALDRADFLVSLNEFLHQRQDIRYLFSVGEVDIEALSSLYEELNRTRGLVMARPDVIEKCLNKAKTYDMAARLGIPMPETHTADNFYDLKAKARSLWPPLVIKPINSLAPLLGQKAIICRGLGELDGWAPGISMEPRPLILQRWVRGERHNCHFAALSGTIVAYFEQKVLRIDRLDSTGKDYTYHIVTAAGRMDHLIQDLLTYSRLGASQLQLRPISLGSLVTEIVSHMEAELRRREARVIVESPFFDVLGHPVALEQVLVNLLSNAIKFVPPGVQPEVWISAEECGEWVRLWVKDNGIGISKEKKKYIFGLFQRLDQNRAYPGTGLGLAIVSRAVSQMGGRVGVESPQEKGSAFWVELRKATSQDH